MGLQHFVYRCIPEYGRGFYIYAANLDSGAIGQVKLPCCLRRQHKSELIIDFANMDDHLLMIFQSGLRFRRVMAN